MSAMTIGETSRTTLPIPATPGIPLLEYELGHGHFGRAADLSACIGICQAYSFEKVIITNIRMQLRDRVTNERDITLFAALLLRHVRRPDDSDIYLAARTAWEMLVRDMQ